MKTKIIIGSLCIAAAVLLASCGASKPCPAYTKVKTEQPHS